MPKRPYPAIPDGWHRLPVEVYISDDGVLILTGDPPDEEADPDCEAHHCDSMGCGLDHILARMQLDDAGRRGVAHLVPPPVVAEPPRESIREAVLRRLGRLPATTGG